MHKYRPMLLFTLALLLLLAACGKAVDAPALVVEEYLTSLVEKNAERVSALSCAAWEPQALMELDSFQAVQTSLEGMACTSTTGEDGSISVYCAGKIMASYNGEDMEFDLSIRTFLVVEEGGDYLVCGYK